MRVSVVRLMLGCICLQLAIGPFAFAESQLDLHPDLRPSVRANRTACRVAFAHSDQKDDGVGLPFLQGNAPEDFEARLKDTISKRGLSWFDGGTFYVTGIDMRNADQTRRSYQEILNRNGLSKKQVRILDVPSRLLGDLSVGLAEHLLQRARYSLPSIERDYQTPTREEIIANLKATAAVEITGAGIVFYTMPFEQALLLKTISWSVLLGYNIYSKAMLNWLLRFGSENKKDQSAEIFGKQLALSLPFTTNYEITGHMMEIKNFYQTYGFDAIVAAFPQQFAEFATSTAGLLTIEQTVFYSAVIVGKFGGWMDRQVGDQNATDARALRPWLQFPILIADLSFLLMATGHGAIDLMQIGPLTVNTGHLGLAGLTAASLWAFDKWPNMLDKALGIYQRRRQRKEAERAANVRPTPPPAPDNLPVMIDLYEHESPSTKPDLPPYEKVGP